jgi:hypothetical protein
LGSILAGGTILSPGRIQKIERGGRGGLIGPLQTIGKGIRRHLIFAEKIVLSPKIFEICTFQQRQLLIS